jgi:hypothetical protein
MPENTGFMIAAYIIVGILYGGYAAWLLLRGRRETQDVRRI